MKIPPIVFKIVWPFLYFFLFICSILFLKFPTSNKNLQLWINIIFWFGIFLNLSWLLIYFYYKNIYLSKIILLMLVLFAFLSLILFSLSNATYKWIVFFLFLPYFLWLCFALFLIFTN